MPEKAKYEFLTGRIQTGKKAGRVLQEEKRYLEEEKRLTELEVQERSLQKELQECRKQLQELTDKQKEAGREKTEKETVLTEKKVRIQDAILQYQSMNAKKEELDKITKEIKNYLNQSETILQKKEILQNNQKEILTFLKKYEKIETCINECRNQKEHIEEQIRHYEELDHQEERKEELKEDCERAKKEADREQKNYENAWAEYEMKYHKFLNEQAGILALNLEDGQPCPVCGSTNHTHPAAMTKDTVTKEELDGAKSKENECEKEKNNSQKIFEDNKRKKDVAFAEVKRYYEICYYLGDKADTSLKDKKGYNASIKDKTDTDIKEHENIRQQENVKDKEYTSFGENKTDKLEENVKTKIKEIKKSLTENEQTIEDLYSKKEEKLKREKAEKETEAKLKEMEENIADNAEMLNKQSVSVGSLSAEMEMLKKELSYESSDTALKELENIRNKIEVLEKRKRELDENILKSDRTKSNLNGTIKENKNQLETDRKNLETEYDDFIKVLKEKEFENEEAYNESLVHIESIEIFDRQIQEYKEEVSKVSSLISVLDDMLDGEKEIDTDVMLQQKAEMEIEAERLANENEITVSKLGTNNSVRDKVSKLMEQRGKLNEKYKIISSLNNVANSKKIHFQTFVLRQYFNMVISYANKRLAVMTSNGFLLKCRDISLTTAGETGLELDVYSPVTGKVRDAHSLSGGETFMASLAMALGMSDIVQNNSGKTQIDTMFIDEGFGSLSDDVRDKAVKILLDLAGSSRLVGVISHVSELKEQIPSKIIVRKDNDGSHITWVQDR